MDIIKIINRVEDIDLKITDNLDKITLAVSYFSKKLKQNFGLNSSQLTCLYILSARNAVSLHDLSKETYLSPSMITNVIDKLEIKKLAKRRPSRKDRRKILVELTAEGKKTVEKAPPVLRYKLLAELSKIRHQEKEKINAALCKLISYIAFEETAPVLNKKAAKDLSAFKE
ncbi:MAG TPA: MarR family transcriptional regulator [Spirochaetota bacterium]|nr:MarR family transcriptional regulator [Spirochaetota bacterium]